MAILQPGQDLDINELRQVMTEYGKLLPNIETNLAVERLNSPEFFPKDKANGGYISEVNGSKQYNTGSHNSGMDQAINSQGIPVGGNEAVGNVQNQENMYNNYVYSDELINPVSGNTFNIDMDKLIKKFKNADTNFEDKNTLDFEAKRLAKANDIEREIAEAGVNPETDFAGGFNLNLFNGDPLKDLLATPSIPGADFNRLSFADTTSGMEGDFQDLLRSPNQNIDDLFGFTLPTVNVTSDSRTNTTQPISPQPGDFTDSGVGESRYDDKVMDPELNTKEAFNEGDVSDIIKGAVTGFDLIRGLTATPEQVDPRLADFSDARRNFQSMSSNMDQARQDVVGSSNALNQDIDNTTRSSGVRNARMLGSAAQLQEALSRVGSIELDKQNQILGQVGQFETQAAIDDANRLYRADEAYAQNKATADMAMERAIDTMSVLGDDYSKKQFAKDMFSNRLDLAALNSAQGFEVLNMLASDFGISGTTEYQNYIANPSDPAAIQALIDKFKIIVK